MNGPFWPSEQENAANASPFDQARGEMLLIQFKRRQKRRNTQ